MKSLKFNHIEAENIKRGLQTATLRVFDEKDISVDDHIFVIDKVKESDSDSWTVIGIAVVDGITIRRAGELQLDGAEFEQFGSTAELYRQLSIYYGDPINESTHIKVIHFTFKPFEVPKNLENLSVDITTNVSEIKLFADGGSRGNPGYSASGYILMTMQDVVLETNGEFIGVTTNNQAEYHALRLGLERARQLGARRIHVFMDSLLVINQMKGIFKVKNKELLPVYRIVTDIIKDFDEVNFTHVPRELNRLADKEVNRILDNARNMV